MKLFSLLALVTGLRKKTDTMEDDNFFEPLYEKIERRPASDFYSKAISENSKGKLSVFDLNMANRLPPNLVCPNPLIKIGLESRIVGGYDSQREAWPFIVKIRVGCGGSIIAANWILTAAHCCRVNDNRFLQVTVSEYDRRAIDQRARTINIKNKYLHPQYDPYMIQNDICLLELEDSIKFHQFAQPVCLPEKNSRIDKVPLGQGALCYVAGWGRVGENENSARILQETQVPIINNTVCKTIEPTTGGRTINEDQVICAGYAEGGIDSCRGDSGGPLICVEDNKPMLRGVVSWGIGCARSGQYGVYTRTSSYIDWIKSIVTPEDVKTTLAPTTTTSMRSLVPGLTKLHPTCGDPEETYKIADNVQVGCNELGCKFFCPKKMRPSITKVLCNSKWGHFVPKRLKRPIFCIEERRIQFKEGIQTGNKITSCGAVTTKFNLPKSINVDCKNDKCNLTCDNPNMKPTLKHIKCISGKSKKGKFLPRRARISCVVKQDSKAMRSMGSTAEETCGYMPVQIAEPASYFCEDMACHFYCPDNLKPSHNKITCNPRKSSWWPKRFSVFCE